MTYQKYILTFIYVYICTLHVISQEPACDKSKCKGPIKYYEDLECVPIYGADSCCPAHYNCDHLKGRSADKCYYKSHVYELGEELREEDRTNPCDIDCSCSEGYNGPAKFSCAEVDCPAVPEPGCYLKKTHDECCDETEVCPQNNTEIAKCEVDGETFLDGQSFTPKSDPTLYCICSEGYTGENVAPFCKPVKPYSCGVELRNSDDIYNNCIPAFYSSQNPATDCNIFSRCQNNDDVVVESQDATKTGETPLSDRVPICVFGNLTMKIGDELNRGTHYSSVCLKCVCEVPPIPTCQRLPDDECDVTVHAKFDDF